MRKLLFLSILLVGSMPVLANENQCPIENEDAFELCIDDQGSPETIEKTEIIEKNADPAQLSKLSAAEEVDNGGGQEPPKKSQIQ